MRTTKVIIPDALARELPATEQAIGAGLAAPVPSQTARGPRQLAEERIALLRAACDGYDAVQKAHERAARDVVDEHNGAATGKPRAP